VFYRARLKKTRKQKTTFKLSERDTMNEYSAAANNLTSIEELEPKVVPSGSWAVCD
jgi:hypothetical protein